MAGVEGLLMATLIQLPGTVTSSAIHLAPTVICTTLPHNNKIIATNAGIDAAVALPQHYSCMR